MSPLRCLPRCPSPQKARAEILPQRAAAARSFLPRHGWRPPSRLQSKQTSLQDIQAGGWQKDIVKQVASLVVDSGKRQ